MIFGLIHESVIDLYLSILSLSDVGKILDGYYQNNIEPPPEIKLMAENLSKCFTESESNALNLFEKRYIDLQLLLLRDRTGKA